MPRRFRGYAKILLILTVLLLANLPDLPIGGWGHDRYRVSHSLFVNTVFLMIIVACVRVNRKLWVRIGGFPVVIGGSCALFSHFLLDSFYNHGLGIAVFWPFSNARIAFPVHWFRTLEGYPPGITWDNLRVLLTELVVYLPITAYAWYSRNKDNQSVRINLAGHDVKMSRRNSMNEARYSNGGNRNQRN